MVLIINLKMNLAHLNTHAHIRKGAFPKLDQIEREIIRKQREGKKQRIDNLLTTIRNETNLPTFTKYFLAKL